MPYGRKSDSDAFAIGVTREAMGEAMEVTRTRMKVMEVMREAMGEAQNKML